MIPVTSYVSVCRARLRKLKNRAEKWVICEIADVQEARLKNPAGAGSWRRTRSVTPHPRGLLSVPRSVERLLRRDEHGVTGLALDQRGVHTQVLGAGLIDLYSKIAQSGETEVFQHAEEGK